MAGVVVAVATEAVNRGLKLPTLTDVTVPVPPPVAVRTPPDRLSPEPTVTSPGTTANVLFTDPHSLPTLMTGKSAATIALKAGVVLPPEVAPARNRLAPTPVHTTLKVP